MVLFQKKATRLPNLPSLEGKGLFKSLFIFGVLMLTLAPNYSFSDIVELNFRIVETKEGDSTKEELIDYLFESIFVGSIHPEEIDDSTFSVIKDFNLAFEEKFLQGSREFLLEASEVTPDLENFHLLAKRILVKGDGLDKIIRTFSHARKASDAIANDDFRKASILLNSLVDAEEKEFVERFFDKGWAKKSVSYLESKNYFKALSAHCRTSESRRTLAIDETLIKGIKNENVTESVLSDDKLLNCLVQESSLNKGLSEYLSKLLDKLLIANLDKNNVSAAEKLYENILTIRPDPNSQNTELRKQIVIRGTDEEKELFALGRIEEMKSRGEFTFSTKLFLMKHGMYGGIWLKGGLLFISLFILLFVMSSLYSKVTDKLPKINIRKKEEPKKRVDEYTKLLKTFGLEDDASEAQIKKAFRKKLKEYHPDTTELAPEEAQRLTDNLKLVYDRILEIRGSWFGNRN